VKAQETREYYQNNNLELARICHDITTDRSLQRTCIQSSLNDKNDFQSLVIYQIDRLVIRLCDLLKLIRKALAKIDWIYQGEH
jgi:DNA invertase Pin-like site-specific DNA recombinase